MKKEHKVLNGTPSKKIFWSIVSDYNLKTAVCELIDNAIDNWAKNGNGKLKVNIGLDVDRQIITISDDSGGVSETDLENLISPGGSENNPDDEVIGYFGVGAKRAVVALAQGIKIITRHGEGKTFQIDIEENWLGDDSWYLPVFEVDQEQANTTSVEMHKLRNKIEKSDEVMLRTDLSEIYGNFLERNVEIFLNGEPLVPIFFSNWASPRGYRPRAYSHTLKTDDGQKVQLVIEAGLIANKEPGEDDYGVYFYCNDRLIVKELKDPQVGYMAGYGGKPHSDASLARIIVKLNGPAKLMPWNSSKSHINYGNNTFKALSKLLFIVVKEFSSLSRGFKGNWEEVFKSKKSEVEAISVSDANRIEKTHHLKLPKVKKNYLEKLKERNKKILTEKPWTLGLVEAMAAVESVKRTNYKTKNRIALILLDSNFEIALKEYIVHHYPDADLQKLFKKRGDVISFITQKVTIDHTLIQRANHYYLIRNKLVHERATGDVLNDDIENYEEVIQKILMQLFALGF